VVLEKRTPKILHQLPKTLVRIEKKINLLVRVGFFMSTNETCRGFSDVFGQIRITAQPLSNGRLSQHLLLTFFNITLTTNIW